MSRRKSELIPTYGEIGVEPAASTSRNPLEQVWSLGEEEFVRRSRTVGRKSELIPIYRSTREETMSTTEDILKVEKEIDERVKSLYGL